MNTQFGVNVSSIEPWFYKTDMLNFDNIRKQIERSWAETPILVRASYGLKAFEYILKVTKYVLGSRFNVEQNVDDVVNAMIEATVAAQPEPVYQVMSWPRRMILKVHYDYLPFEVRSLLVRGTCNLAAVLSDECCELVDGDDNLNHIVIDDLKPTK